jgi:hypothetical protein
MWLLSVAIVAGCSSSAAPTNSDSAQVRMRTLAIFYRQWAELHRGSAPPNREQFIAFIQQDASKLNQTAASPEELLTSPRDNQPLVVAFGTMPKDSAETGFPWIAREKTGVDGKVNTVDMRGRVLLLDAQEISKILPAS